LLTENSVRHIDTLREMEAHKRHYQIRCSHHELEFSATDRRITCAICGKNWVFVKERGYSDPRQVYAAEKDE
jgi:DNA-directed RNA polymerase subunit RPC12/RpoP